MHKAIATHKNVFPEPISLEKNECFQLFGKTNNWVGWVPDCLVLHNDNHVRAAFDYCARELNATPEQFFEVEEPLNGWSWCKDNHANYGWLPTNILTAC